MNEQFPNILADEIELGKGVFIDPSASIRGLDGPAMSIRIGDHSFIGAGVQVICNEFSLGDYCKVHHHTNIHGYKPCRIGHNAWIGQYSVIDCIGGTHIGNNCGIGAHSQLWSHIKYGDSLEGNRFLSEKMMNIGNDVWFVGHCIVSPITAEDKSMAMVGSVVTRDMVFNSVYAGVPAIDMTEKVGPQFSEVTSSEKLSVLRQHLNDFTGETDAIRIVEDVNEFKSDGRSYFAVATREYNKTLSDIEVAFMKYLLPEKGKFTPVDDVSKSVA